MIIKGVTAVVILLLSFVITSSMMAQVNQANEDVRTKARTATSLACTVASGATSCDITLPSKHQYDTIVRATVTETSPGSNVNRTNESTLESDRDSISITGLTASTSYLFTVAYYELATGVDQNTADVMSLIPLFMVFGTLIISILWLLSSLGVMGGLSGRT